MECGLSPSEVMAICIYYHLSGYKCFKYYYKNCVLEELKSYFPQAVSYNRFIEIKKRVSMALFCFIHCRCLGEVTGVGYIDSTKLEVCDNHRIHSHKVFADLAKRGKTSTGWFYGLKLHLLINESGELLGLAFSSGNVSDNNPEVVSQLCSYMDWGKIFGDAGYISQKLFEILYQQGITLFTKIRKNMKNKLMTMQDKIYLKKRSLVETVIDLLKNICDLWHTRHRSVDNAFNNMLSALAAYSFFDHKPQIRHYGKKLVLLKDVTPN